MHSQIPLVRKSSTKSENMRMANAGFSRARAEMTQPLAAAQQAPFLYRSEETGASKALPTLALQCVSPHGPGLRRSRKPKSVSATARGNQGRKGIPKSRSAAQTETVCLF